MKEVIEILTKRNKTISTMESCTGGGIADAITNIEGASEVFSFGAVTYSNFYKIKMGVSSEVIDKYSVYSFETVKEMSKSISKYTNSNYGIGVSGKLNRADENNRFGKDNEVFFSIYDRDNDKYYCDKVSVALSSRRENKDVVIDKIVNKLLEVLGGSNE